MKHIPHLVVGAPWDGPNIDLSVVQWRHVTKVLKMKSGQEVTYTDGLGVMGAGTLGHHVIERGDEQTVPRPSRLTVAVAPPSNKDRQRFLVEKLAEMGISRLLWLETRHGKNRTPNPSKVFSWVHAAVEQSRGAYLMETAPEMVRPAALEGRVVFCRMGGDHDPGETDVVAIGPEGGFSEDELPENAPLWDLGPTVLRVETAALVAASRLGSL